ncbi:MAG: NAD(P)H-hydrate epimerase [Candidatus Nanoarchaeia archaeon]
MEYITKKQAAKLDELMTKKFHISNEMMMELAGYRLAEFIRDNFREREILIATGKGNNAGDGLCAARHLLNFGFSVNIFLASPELCENSLKHLRIAKTLCIPLVNTLENHKLVLDCIFGYNLKGKPKEPFSEAIKAMNKNKKIIACDIPSGIDADEGIIHEPYVKATHILFLGMPKVGCKKLKAKKFVADIGVPKKLYPKIEAEEKNHFSKKEIIKLEQ